MTIKIEVVPVEVKHASDAGQVAIDLNIRDVVYKVIEIGVDEVSARRQDAGDLDRPGVEIVHVADHQRRVDDVERRAPER